MKFQQVQELWEINPNQFLGVFSPPSQKEHQLFSALCGAAVRGKTDLVQVSLQELERESGLKDDELSAMLAQLEEQGVARRIKGPK
jgi:anthranilate phosphoribosyltransferase